jgi:hypothetical protein
LETQKTTNSQGSTEQKATLEISQYLTSSYATEPSNKNSMTLAQKIDTKTSGTE